MATRQSSAQRTRQSNRTQRQTSKPQGPDVTAYADKPATDYHKTLARWFVNVVGYKPTDKASFLAGIRLACTARNLFMASEEAEAWRESTGQAKRGPKPKTEEPAATRSTRGAKTRKVEPEPVVDDDDDFDDDDNDDDEFEDTDEADEFDDDDSDDDDSDDDDFDDDDSDDDDDDDDFEEAPAPKSARRGTAPGATNRGQAAVRRTPAKAQGRRAKSKSDDEFAF